MLFSSFILAKIYNQWWINHAYPFLFTWHKTLQSRLSLQSCQPRCPRFNLNQLVNKAEDSRRQESSGHRASRFSSSLVSTLPPLIIPSNRPGEGTVFVCEGKCKNEDQWGLKCIWDRVSRVQRGVTSEFFDVMIEVPGNSWV